MNFEAIAARFIPFGPATVCLEKVPDLTGSHRSAVALFIRFKGANAVVERDDDEKVIVKISICPRRTGCRFSVALLDLRRRFADSSECD